MDYTSWERTDFRSTSWLRGNDKRDENRSTGGIEFDERLVTIMDNFILGIFV